MSWWTPYEAAAGVESGDVQAVPTIAERRAAEASAAAHSARINAELDEMAARERHPAGKALPAGGRSVEVIREPSRRGLLAEVVIAAVLIVGVIRRWGGGRR